MKAGLRIRQQRSPKDQFQQGLRTTIGVVITSGVGGVRGVLGIGTVTRMLLGIGTVPRMLLLLLLLFRMLGMMMLSDA